MFLINLLSLYFILLYSANAIEKSMRSRAPKANQITPPGLAFSLIEPTAGTGFSVNVFSDQCVYQCANENKMIATYAPLFELSHPWIDIEQVDNDTMGEFCRYAKIIKNCVQQCPDSNSKTAFQLAFKASSYMCDNTKYYHCFKYSIKAASKCQTDEKDENCCYKEENVVFQNYTTVDFSDMQITSSYFDNICLYYKCYMNCAKPTFVRNCTEEGFGKFKRTYQMKIHAAKETFEAMGHSYTEPDNCIDFRQDSD